MELFLQYFFLDKQKLEDDFDLLRFIFIFTLVNLPFLHSPKTLTFFVINSEPTGASVPNINFAQTQDHSLLN